MVRVRFAPSPTGFLHQGNIRTALFNYFFAKGQGGQFILRIEDTDRERSKPEFESQILKDLQWLGLDYDEGPDKGGPHGPYRQSEREEIYQRHLKELQAAGKVYPCFCTHEDLEAERRRALATGKAYRYSGKCRCLDEAQRAEKLSAGNKASFRFAVEPKIVKFQDLVYGEKVFDTSHIGDFVVGRSDESPLYLFTCAIDDCLMKISHVIRGEDGLSNTPRQILIQEALGLESPNFAHLPLILGPDHTLLSKRNGSSSMNEFREMGYLVPAIVNYLALLGWAPPDKNEVLALDSLVARFDLSKVARSSAIFDWDKLKYFNQIYLRRLSDEEYLSKARESAKQTISSLGEIPEENLNKTLLALRPNIQTFGEVGEWLGLILGEPNMLGEEAKEALSWPSTPKVLQSALGHLKEMQGDFTPKNFEGFIEAVKKKAKLKGKKLFMPLRITVTGHSEGPELKQLFCSLGKDKILARVESALKNLQHPEPS